MKAYSFPCLCPVCGATVRTAPDAVARHSSCMTLAAKCLEWSNAMRSLADQWPDGTSTHGQSGAKVRARMVGTV